MLGIGDPQVSYMPVDTIAATVLMLRIMVIVSSGKAILFRDCDTSLQLVFQLTI